MRKTFWLSPTLRFIRSILQRPIVAVHLLATCKIKNTFLYIAMLQEPQTPVIQNGAEAQEPHYERWTRAGTDGALISSPLVSSPWGLIILFSISFSGV